MTSTAQPGAPATLNSAGSFARRPSERHESGSQVPSRGAHDVVVEDDDLEDFSDAPDRPSTAPLKTEDHNTSQGEITRQGSMPVPAPGALNSADPRGPVPAFRIVGHPEFENAVQMPEAVAALSRTFPGGLEHADSGSSADSQGTQGMADEERMWEENQALYKAIQSRLGIEDSTPSERSSYAPTPVLPVPGGFPDAFRFGGAVASESGGEEPSAFHVRPTPSFPQSTHGGSSPGPNPLVMPKPSPWTTLESPSTDTFLTTGTESEYLTPNQLDSETGHGYVGETDDDNGEDYTQTLRPSFPVPAPRYSIPEPGTPTATSGMPKPQTKPQTRPSIPMPLISQMPSASIPEAQPDVVMPKPATPHAIPQPQTQPSIPQPTPSPPVPKPETVPTFPTPPKQNVPRPQQPPPPPQTQTPPSLPTKPTTVTSHSASSAQAPAAGHAPAPAKPSHPSHPSLPQVSPQQQKPPRPQQQTLVYSAPTASTGSGNQAKPPGKQDHLNGNSFGGKPTTSGLAPPHKPASTPAPSHSSSTLGASHPPKPTKPTGSAFSANNMHAPSSTSLSSVKPSVKPTPSNSELKPPKVSPSHSTTGSPGKHDHGPTASSSSGKANGNGGANTRYVNMLLALDDIPHFWNLLASFFTWILLAGFLLFPGTFTSWREEQAQATGAAGVSDQVKGAVLDVVARVPLYVIAWICSGIGVAGMVWLWWRWMSNYIWLLNKVFVPGLLNALAGLVSTLANIFGAQGGQLSTTALTTLIVTAASTGILAIMVLFYQFWLLRRVQNEHWKTVGKQKAGRHGEGVLKGMMQSKSQALKQGA